MGQGNWLSTVKPPYVQHWPKLRPSKNAQWNGSGLCQNVTLTANVLLYPDGAHIRQGNILAPQAMNKNGGKKEFIHEQDHSPFPSIPLMESHSFTDALYSVLAEKGWFTLPKCMLSGMTAACFRFSVHRQLHSDSATAYNWMAEHLVACDLIGVTASQMGGFNFTPTFPLYQQQAISDIKACIDRGTGAVVWKDRFVIVNGYHEQKQVFYYLDRVAESCRNSPT